MRRRIRSGTGAVPAEQGVGRGAGRSRRRPDGKIRNRLSTSLVQFKRLSASEIDAYLARLSVEGAVPVVDARRWIEDAAFSDGHHLLPDGAAAFTQRFNHDMLQPLFSGWHALAAGKD